MKLGLMQELEIQEDARIHKAQDKRHTSHFRILGDKGPLRRFVDALTPKGKRLTTRGLIREAHICAVNTVADELRKNGVPVDCERVGRRFMYSLGGGK